VSVYKPREIADAIDSGYRRSRGMAPRGAEDAAWRPPPTPDQERELEEERAQRAAQIEATQALTQQRTDEARRKAEDDKRSATERAAQHSADLASARYYAKLLGEPLDESNPTGAAAMGRHLRDRFQREQDLALTERREGRADSSAAHRKAQDNFTNAMRRAQAAREAARLGALLQNQDQSKYSSSLARESEYHHRLAAEFNRQLDRLGKVQILPVVDEKSGDTTGYRAQWVPAHERWGNPADPTRPPDSAWDEAMRRARILVPPVPGRMSPTDGEMLSPPPGGVGAADVGVPGVDGGSMAVGGDGSLDRATVGALQELLEDPETPIEEREEAIDLLEAAGVRTDEHRRLAPGRGPGDSSADQLPPPPSEDPGPLDVWQAAQQPQRAAAFEVGRVGPDPGQLPQRSRRTASDARGVALSAIELADNLNLHLPQYPASSPDAKYRNFMNEQLSKGVPLEQAKAAWVTYDDPFGLSAAARVKPSSYASPTRQWDVMESQMAGEVRRRELDQRIEQHYAEILAGLR